MFRKLILWTVIAIIVAAGSIYAAFQFSPWPSVWLIRNSFDKGAAEAAASNGGLVPPGISAQRGLNYASGDRDALLDVYAPSDAMQRIPAPTAVLREATFV